MKFRIILYDMSNHEYLKDYEIEYKYPEDFEDLLFPNGGVIEIPKGYYLSHISFNPNIKHFTYYLFEGVL